MRENKSFLQKVCQSKDIKIFFITVTGIFLVFAFMAAGIYYSWFPDIGTLRPLPKEPSSLDRLTNQQLIKQLTPPKGWYFELEQHKLILKPVQQPIPNQHIVNPTLERGLLLDLADPYVFASPDGKTHWYTLTVFCYKNKECGYANTFKNGTILEPWFFLSAQTKRKEVAQMQLEIIRKLILLAGGKSSVDKTKILARLHYDAVHVKKNN